MTAERVLPLSGVHNFRDYGGYRTSDGGQVKSATLFRSGQHRDATGVEVADAAQQVQAVAFGQML